MGTRVTSVYTGPRTIPVSYECLNIIFERDRQILERGKVEREGQGLLAFATAPLNGLDDLQTIARRLRRGSRNKKTPTNFPQDVIFISWTIADFHVFKILEGREKN